MSIKAGLYDLFFQHEIIQIHKEPDELIQRRHQGKVKTVLLEHKAVLFPDVEMVMLVLRIKKRYVVGRGLGQLRKGISVIGNAVAVIQREDPQEKPLIIEIQYHRQLDGIALSVFRIFPAARLQLLAEHPADLRGIIIFCHKFLLLMFLKNFNQYITDNKEFPQKPCHRESMFDG